MKKPILRVFVSQPMRGLSDDEIMEARTSLVKKIDVKFPESEIQIIDSFLDISGNPDTKHIPLYYLSKSFELLSGADVAVFGKGYNEARGCRLEHIAATEYGIKVVLENNL